MTLQADPSPFGFTEDKSCILARTDHPVIMANQECLVNSVKKQNRQKQNKTKNSETYEGRPLLSE